MEDKAKIPIVESDTNFVVLLIKNSQFFARFLSIFSSFALASPISGLNVHKSQSPGV